MTHESCSELYYCPRVKLTPMIRILLRCTAAEAMESICATCKAEQAEVSSDNVYISPSGQKIAVVVGEKSEEAEEVLMGTQSVD
jgi:hypothetical protein